MDLHGASADAVAALESELSSAASSPDVAAGLGGDLFAVALTLRGEGALRRFATDGSVPVEAKRGIVGDLFQGRIGDAAAGLLSSAVGRRWTGGRDLPDALEHLSVMAYVTSADDSTGRLVDELFTLGQLVKDNPELRDALSDPVRSSDDKGALLESILGGKALPATVALAKQALSGSYRTVSTALAAYERTAAGVYGQSVATVRVARELSEAESTRLSQALSTQYGRPIHLNLLVDPSVLGGMRVEIGDDVIDGTISSRLADARRSIAG